MTAHFHAVVYIDHSETLIFNFAEGDVKEHRVRPKDREGNLQHLENGGI